MIQTEILFNGPDYVPARDNVRLIGQIKRIFVCMMDQKYRTVKEISEITGDPENSISAQLRHLRKYKFGKHIVHKKYLGSGLYKYQLLVNGDPEDFLKSRFLLTKIERTF